MPYPASKRNRDNGVRRLIGRLLLSLALVLAQGSALNHFIGHLADMPRAGDSQRDARYGDDNPADPAEVCAECLALGGIDLPLDDHPGRGVFTAVCLAPPSGVTAAPAQAATLPPRCRAPPAFG